MSFSRMLFEFRAPRSVDGANVHALIERCPPLDTNSLYCNLLQCAYFRETSILVTHEKEVVGFVSGFIAPKSPNTLFIWQVAVDHHYRGMGLAKKMITELVKRQNLEHITHIETTITPDNASSWQLFKRVAVALGANLKSKTLFDQELHFGGEHASEQLVKIGPIKQSTSLTTTHFVEEKVCENF